ncbi:IS30 family transposase [Sulfurovum mangrovi]|uniref:IS30 family transposase n=1 Tax=Sulfurovum mangrovi TaxID=2893889 RepID=UPI001E2BC860|nr:IS30 family transposase [Sulfurovum mangrovi]UFH58038.1 IS30 family transposase [Sulfurovum mangrovi]UFH58337.1 IS30 family transposase [Sulfurovum mangrovi]UFH59161.1 IS30 family transposase [Sulfurovum mangrovi]UFH60332.1 IS30 family transposase [Sulfurovum mangrovi]UFH60430.1 IS30 family transposase [Sulfurovum mangrovi]
MSYKHLTLKERYLINAYRNTKTQKEIAKIVGVHPSTISRELKRGRGKIGKEYWVIASHNRATEVQIEKSKKANLKLTKETKELIKKYLKKEFSPEQIAATLEMKHSISVSYVTIYTYIHVDKLGNGTLHTHLRQQGRRRKKYGQSRKNRIKERVSIEERPSLVDDKVRVGDFEADTIIGKGRQGAIVTIVDRKSMYLKLSLPVNKRSHVVANEMVRLLAPFKKKVHTITTDNGLEFAGHRTISKKLKCDYYFCHPYSSWERGLNENINGLIRQYIPKGSSFEHLTQKEIRRIENRLNHRPRKSLGWRTPYEVFHENLKVS